MKRFKIFILVFVLVVFALSLFPYRAFADDACGGWSLNSYTVSWGDTTLGSGSVTDVSLTSNYNYSFSFILDSGSDSNFYPAVVDLRSNEYLKLHSSVGPGSYTITGDLSCFVSEGFIQAGDTLRFTGGYFGGSCDDYCFPFYYDVIASSDWVGGSNNILVDVSLQSPDCASNTFDFSLSTNFNLSSVSNVTLNGLSVSNYFFNTSTWVLTVSDVSYTSDGSYTLGFDFSGTNPDDGSPVSGSTSFSFTACVSAGVNHTYRAGLDVKCGTDTGGNYYSLVTSFFVDGQRVSNFTGSYTASPRGGTDTSVTAVMYGDTYIVTGYPVDDIDDYSISLVYNGVTFTLDASNLACGDSFNYDFDDLGNLINKAVNSLLDVLKAILDQIIAFFKFVGDMVALVFAFVKLALALVPFISKWILAIVTDIFGIVVAFIQGLLSPSSSLSLTLPTLDAFGISSTWFLNSLADMIVTIEGFVPSWFWWVLAGFALLPVFGIRFSSNSQGGSDDDSGTTSI